MHDAGSKDRSNRIALPPAPGLEVESSELVWNGRFPLQLVRFRHRRFDGGMTGTRTWELWRRGSAAALLPYDPIADVVVLIEQFRLPAAAAGFAPVMVEIAAGLCDAGESPEETVRREAVEEMGIAPGALVRMGNFLLSPGGCDEHVTIFAGDVRLDDIPAGGILGHGGLSDEDEDIRVRAVPAQEAIDQAVSGGYPNVVTTLALLWLAARRDKLRMEWGARLDHP